MNGKFLHDMLVNWLYGGIIVLVMGYYSGTCLEGNLHRKTTCTTLNKQFIPTKCIHVFLRLVLGQKRCDILSQNISAVKKGEAKKVQVTERLEGVKLL